MVPTLAATLGVKGHRPTVPTRDCKDLLYVFAVANLVSAALHTNTLESPRDAGDSNNLSDAIKHRFVAKAALWLGLPRTGRQPRRSPCCGRR
jgi:hypothetical protein